MLNFEASSILDPSARSPAEIARDPDNLLVQTCLKIDHQILVAQQRVRAEGYGPLPRFDTELATLHALARDTITEADLRGEGEWPDYYRLVSQTAFLEQRLKVPLAFEKRKYRREREHLVNGIYGVSAQIIQSVLADHNSPTTSPADRKELRGVLQEQTAIALFNREQEPGRIALPAATSDDLFYRTDVDIWTLPDGEQQPYYIPVQIKSLAPLDEKRVTPKGGITIIASDFRNQYLEISHLIAQEYDDMIGAGEPLTLAESRRLDAAHYKLMTIMTRKAQAIDFSAN